MAGPPGDPKVKAAAGQATGRWRLLRDRRLLLVAGLALVVGLAWLALRGADVPTVAATRGTAAEVVYATGIVEPVTWAKVTALQRRRIVEICKCEGQTVKKGEVLVRLDDVEERAMLAELQTRLARLREDADRLTILAERSITSRTTVDEKLTQVHEYEARVTAQKNRISDLSLTSPMDGVVLRRDGEVGEIAGTAATDTLIWVGQPKPLQLVAEVNEADIFRVQPGQRALLRHDGHAGSPLEGKVDRITPKGDAQAKTFRVYIALPDDTPLKIGMSVEANVVVATVADAILVPAEAIGEQNRLQIVRDGRIEVRPVDVGIRGTPMAEIRRGVEAGAAVVSPWQKDLAPGARVRSGSRVP